MRPPPPGLNQSQRIAFYKAQHRTNERVERQAEESQPCESNPYRRQLESLQDRLRYAVGGEREQIKRRIADYKKEADKFDAQKEAAERRRKFEASETYRLMREHFDSFQRTPPLGATDAEIMEAAAIVNCDKFATPEDQGREYFALTSRIYEAAHARHLRKQSEAQEAADKAAMDVARADLEAKQAEFDLTIARNRLPE